MIINRGLVVSSTASSSIATASTAAATAISTTVVVSILTTHLEVLESESKSKKKFCRRVTLERKYWLAWEEACLRLERARKFRRREILERLESEIRERYSWKIWKSDDITWVPSLPNRKAIRYRLSSNLERVVAAWETWTWTLEYILDTKTDLILKELYCCEVTEELDTACRIRRLDCFDADATCYSNHLMTASASADDFFWWLKNLMMWLLRILWLMTSTICMTLARRIMTVG